MIPQKSAGLICIMVETEIMQGFFVCMHVLLKMKDCDGGQGGVILYFV
jgi:hypothetical protein